MRRAYATVSTRGDPDQALPMFSQSQHIDYTLFAFFIIPHRTHVFPTKTIDSMTVLILRVKTQLDSPTRWLNRSAGPCSGQPLQ